VALGQGGLHLGLARKQPDLFAKIVEAGITDLMFSVDACDPETYQRVRDSGVINKELVAGLYRQREEDVLFFHCDNAQAIKFSIPRPIFSGDLGDSDVYGGQQYAPLLDIEVPDKP